MTHEMNLYGEYFDLFKEEAKNIEYRLNDEKRKNIKIGDVITFYKLPLKDETINMLVTDMKYYPNLFEMYEATFDIDFKNNYHSVQDVVDDTSYYSKEEVEKYGCVAIYLKKMS